MHEIWLKGNVLCILYGRKRGNSLLSVGEKGPTNGCLWKTCNLLENSLHQMAIFTVRKWNLGVEVSLLCSICTRMKKKGVHMFYPKLKNDRPCWVFYCSIQTALSHLFRACQMTMW